MLSVGGRVSCSTFTPERVAGNDAEHTVEVESGYGVFTFVQKKHTEALGSLVDGALRPADLLDHMRRKGEATFFGLLRHRPACRNPIAVMEAFERAISPRTTFTAE